MSGRDLAPLEKCWAHEARRNHRRPAPLAERRWINSLDSPDLERHVRELNAVDRAVEAGQRAREAA